MEPGVSVHQNTDQVPGGERVQVHPVPAPHLGEGEGSQGVSVHQDTDQVAGGERVQVHPVPAPHLGVTGGH